MITFTFHLLTVMCAILLVAAGETTLHIRKRHNTPRVAREIRDAATRVVLESRRTQDREFLTAEDVRFLTGNGWRPDTARALAPAAATPKPVRADDDLPLDGEIVFFQPTRTDKDSYKNSIRSEASRMIIEGKVTRHVKGHSYYCDCSRCGSYGYFK